MVNKNILVIDDDESVLKSIARILRLRDFLVDPISDPNQIDKCLQSKEYNCVLLDIRIPGTNGIDILNKIHANYTTLPVIMISAYSDTQAAVQSIKDGAYDYIEKPIDPERLFISLGNAIQKQRLLKDNELLSRRLKKESSLLLESNQIKIVYEKTLKVADTTATVLIMGETGVGKELIARAIHDHSKRKDEPYVKINCAAIPHELLESELFGHRKGSFTGAFFDRKGKILEADGGTIFLDEIGEMDVRLQAKLLHVLDNRELQVLGEANSRIVDVRFITASNKDLNRMSQEGKFRQDLYHRINVVNIVIPPLRERIEDILPIGYHYLNAYSQEYNKPVVTLSRQAEATLLHHSWPGNVRELKNLMEKLVIYADKYEISIDDVLEHLDDNNPVIPVVQDDDSNNLSFKEAQELFEKRFLIQALNQHEWKMTETAKSIGIDRSNLFKKLKKLGLK